MSNLSYTSPRLRNILLGILAAAVLLTLFGFLGDIVKWTGAALLFVPARLGLIRQATTNEVLPVDFSTSPTSFFFPQAGRYALYTSDYDLLVITDTLIESGGRPWLVISSSDGKNLPVDFITRGLQPYDTPLAKGRPIYTFSIPSAGTYSISHPTRPSLTVYFVRDYVSGQEALHTSILVLESLGLIGLIAFFTYRRYGQKHRRLRAERAQKRQQVEAFWKERRQRQENATDGKPKSRWDDLG